MRVYFAHPISDYSTNYEAQIVGRVQRAMAAQSQCEVVIENPNQPHHQEGYAARSMAYFLEDVLPNCDGCVFDRFPGGVIGSGVAMEVQHFLDARKPVWRVAQPPVFISRVSELPPWVASRDVTRELSKLYKTMPNGGRA